MRNCPYHKKDSECEVVTYFSFVGLELFLCWWWINPLYKYCQVYREIEKQKSLEALGYNGEKYK